MALHRSVDSCRTAGVGCRASASCEQTGYCCWVLLGAARPVLWAAVSSVALPRKQAVGAMEACGLRRPASHMRAAQPEDYCVCAMSGCAGKLTATGSGAGKGFTINVPLPGDSGHDSMLDVWQRVVDPAARRFQPDIIICSAGEAVGGLRMGRMYAAMQIMVLVSCS